MSAISSWLNESKVQFVPSVSDWKSAIELAGRPLLNEGAISQSYIDAIIQQKEATGPYFVIAPGIAMPHARPEQGAVSLGLSVLKIGEPVNFDSEENGPVVAVFMFSAPDSNSHIEMISQLAEVLSDDDMMEKVFAVQSTDELQALLLSKK